MKQQIVTTLAILSWIQVLAGSPMPAGVSLFALRENRNIDFSRDVQPIFASHCYSCHGPEKQKSGFRLDTKERAMAGGDTGKAILPGKSEQSLLYRYVAGLHPETRMPPKGDPLSSNQVALLRAWIDSGASWLENQAPSAKTHWSLKKPLRPSLPNVRNSRWVRNAIDAFILSKLESLRISPSPEADRPTLIRRLSLDLVGLPPTPDEVGAFVRDRRADAYDRLVESFLASPHFGERWGRHWLDLARYADSEGYQVDKARPWAYVYRNWVIDAFNRDLPFDQFTIEQLAGDLLPNATRDQLIAVGFHRNTLMNHEDGVDREEFRCKAKSDRVATTGTTWLGLTLGCAECHTHKYDPITQKEFFQLYAFFNNADEADISAPQPAELEVYAQRKNAWESETARIKSLLARCEEVDPISVKLNLQLQQLAKATPQYQEPLAQSFKQFTNTVRTFVHVRGDFLRKGDEVRPGVLAALHPFKPRGEVPDRLDLARWIADPANPLASRVAVNQIWQHLFGRGLVATPEDFGVRGEPPSHPELLDFLATEFLRLGWSRKEMIRLIVGSAAYRQTAEVRSDLAAVDPNNTLLARQNRFRLESEIVRDLYLACGGILNNEIKGPSFRPPVPDDFKALGGAGAFTWVDSEGADKYRRGLYIFSQRTVPYPVSMTFDAPNPSESCPRREYSNTPLQALTLMNNPTFVECTQGLARRMFLASAPLSTPCAPNAFGDQRLSYGFELCLGRKPSRPELLRLEKLFDDARRLVARDRKSAAALLGNVDIDQPDIDEAAGMVLVAQVLMNLDEFVTRE